MMTSKTNTSSCTLKKFKNGLETKYLSAISLERVTKSFLKMYDSVMRKTKISHNLTMNETQTSSKKVKNLKALRKVFDRMMLKWFLRINVSMTLTETF